MIQFADLFHLALPFLVVVQPTFYLFSLLGPDAELPVLPSWIRYRQNPHLMSFTRLTPDAAFAVKDRAFEQRTAQHLFGRGQ